MLPRLVVSRWWQRKEAFSLVDGFSKPTMALIESDEVDEVAMLAGRGIDPVADCAALGLEEPDIEAAPRRSGNIANHPIASLAPTGGEVMAANGLCILGEPL